MSDKDYCCLRDLVADECHTSRWSNVEKCFHKIENIAEEEVETIISRVPGLKNIELTSICDYHYKAYFTYYTCKKKCFDPWKKHSHSNTYRLSVINLELSKKADNCLKIKIPVGHELCKECIFKLKNDIVIYEDQFKYCVDPFKKRNHEQVTADLTNLDEASIAYLKRTENLEFTVSHKVCSACKNYLKLLISEVSQVKKEIEVIEVSDDDSESQNEFKKLSLENKETSGSDFITTSQCKRNLDSMLSTLGIPSFQRKKMNNEAVINCGLSIVESVIKKVSEAFEEANEVKLPDLQLSQSLNESLWFKSMIANIKSKFYDTNTSYDEKVSLLTLLPKNWNLQQINQYFECNKYMLKESLKLRENKGKII